MHLPWWASLTCADFHHQFRGEVVILTHLHLPSIVTTSPSAGWGRWRLDKRAWRELWHPKLGAVLPGAVSVLSYLGTYHCLIGVAEDRVCDPADNEVTWWQMSRVSDLRSSSWKKSGHKSTWVYHPTEKHLQMCVCVCTLDGTCLEEVQLELCPLCGAGKGQTWNSPPLQAHPIPLCSAASEHKHGGGGGVWRCPAWAGIYLVCMVDFAVFWEHKCCLLIHLP